ncbi:hypothetical protein DLAC_02840 [Tieghemostelium lacteum]|uniref:Uncharacterized protein n=1 Tax=Tieghemostelium lacteum TaxID=361077 RepID=A0A152A3J9_TIELA|nr:hypothetical protein DLAC_02840 [Tieghemostelium lacteum]|eukprot:KYR00790.1 hypothetical protein DLAC_02840 [Tieghemostelium lacteum]
MSHGYISFSGSSYNVNFDQNNLIDNPLTGYFTVSMCIPIDTIDACGIQNQPAIQCTYSIVTISTDGEKTEFSYDQILSQWPGETFIIIQNTKMFEINEFMLLRFRQ